MDYAIRPEKPISPKVMKMASISLGVGCALAGGIVYLFFIFDNAIRSKKDIEDIFRLPILVEIGAIKQPKDKFKDKMNALALILASFYVVAIIGGFVMLELQGIERTINLINSYINI